MKLVKQLLIRTA